MDSGAFPGVVENELSVMTWAREAGFSVPLCEMVDVDRLGPVATYAQPGLKAFAIARYDRADGRRIHQEDLAQVVGIEPHRRYEFTHEKLVNLLYQLLGPEAYDELVRRITFVVASGNNDAHLKNWSIVYRNGVLPTLAPLYDQVSTVAWAKFDRKLAFKLGGASEFGRVDHIAFRKLASKVGVDPARTERIVVETIERLRDAFRRIGPSLPLVEDHARALRDHWMRVPLLREVGELP
jgi:serine/threonine-protein kinase HipA